MDHIEEEIKTEIESRLEENGFDASENQTMIALHAAQILSVLEDEIIKAVEAARNNIENE